MHTFEQRLINGKSRHHPMQLSVHLHHSASGREYQGSPADGIRAGNMRIVVDFDPPRYAGQIERGRELGWYETRGEGMEGASALAVSGWLGGQPVALSLAGPSERMARDHEINLQALREVQSTLLAE